MTLAESQLAALGDVISARVRKAASEASREVGASFEEAIGKILHSVDDIVVRLDMVEKVAGSLRIEEARAEYLAARRESARTSGLILDQRGLFDRAMEEVGAAKAAMTEVMAAVQKHNLEMATFAADLTLRVDDVAEKAANAAVDTRLAEAEERVAETIRAEKSSMAAFRANAARAQADAERRLNEALATFEKKCDDAIAEQIDKMAGLVKAHAEGDLPAPILPVWRGPWTSTSTYERGHLTISKGSAWIAVMRNAGEPPAALPDGPWHIFAAGVSVPT